MFRIDTSFFCRVLRINKDKSWNKLPKEMTEEKIPVKLSEKPSSLVRLAKKEPETKMEIKYSIAAEMI